MIEIPATIAIVTTILRGISIAILIALLSRQLKLFKVSKNPSIRFYQKVIIYFLLALLVSNIIPLIVSIVEIFDLFDFDSLVYYLNNSISTFLATVILAFLYAESK